MTSCAVTCGKNHKDSMVTLTEDVFGEHFTECGKIPIKRFTWVNSNKLRLQVITYGATITTLSVPDKNGKVDDIVTGFNTLEEYFSPSNRYFGASIGRFANRIEKAQFTLDGVQYKLEQNNNGNALHGGIKGFDKVVWNPYVDGTKLTLSYLSKDMEEGYPGDLLVFITFELTAANEVIINYKATTSKSTIINLTNHSYFNLAGHNNGLKELYMHEVWINANSITEVDDKAIPTGKIMDVTNTFFDLRQPRKLGNVINQIPHQPGYDHNYCVNDKNVAKVVHPPTGRVMEVTSTQPGVQFYTANFLPNDDSLKGKDGYYSKHGAFCLETQNYPDAINKCNFPSPVLRPGEVYNHTTIYTFSVQK